MIVVFLICCSQFNYIEQYIDKKEEEMICLAVTRHKTLNYLLEFYRMYYLFKVTHLKFMILKVI